MSLVWQPDDAKDLLSEVTLTAYENFESLKQPDQFVYFLFGIARNLYLKKLRKQKFQMGLKQYSFENLAISGTSNDQMCRRELSVLLSRLKPNEQECVTLFEIAGFSYEEIAKIQNISLAMVKTNIFQARQKLKIEIELEEERFSNAANDQKNKLLITGGKS